MMRLAALRPVLMIVTAGLVLAGTSISVHAWLNRGPGLPPNSPAAAALYWRSLSRLAAQPHFQISESYRQLLPASMAPFDSVNHRHGPVFGLNATTYRIRGSAQQGIEVLKVVRASSIFVPPFRLVLRGRMLCLGFQGQSTVCSPTHRMPAAVYLSDYLFGGQVDGLRFSRSSADRSRAVKRPAVTTIQISGHGALGCTPAYAGAGTKAGYHWCRPADAPAGGRVSAELTIATATGLPIRFTATGTKFGEPSFVRATFFYTESFTIRLGRVARIPCSSWVPAIHCIELGRKNLRL